MALQIVVPASEFPITLDEAKAHLRVDFDDDNDLISALIGAATEYCNGPGGFLGRCLVDQTWRLTIDKFPVREIKIPLPPLREIVSVKYDDASGVEQLIDVSLYKVDAASEPGWLLPVGSWPATFGGVNSVRIEYVAGYGDDGNSPPANAVPADIKAAIKMIVATLYENRENIVIGQTVQQIPTAAEWLLRRKRFDLSMA